MFRLIYKLYLALYDTKLIEVRRLFILGFNVRKKKYSIWYIGGIGFPKLYDIYDSNERAMFKWKILMNRS